MEYKYGAPDEYGDFPYLYSGQYKAEELNTILFERLPDNYPMQLVNPIECEIVAQIVNQGIDAHLEAATLSEEPHLVPIKISDKVVGHKYGIGFDKLGMICFIRRLMHYDPNDYEPIEGACGDDENAEDYDPESNPWEVAYHLVSAILETLQIEYAG